MHRIDEQIAKGLDRKVWLPSGGSLVIDRTEAMTVVDVNTGKFTGSGGNLEETVTKNNLEAAEEIVRQLRLRDIGGIIVVDFIDMVLESNRDLVVRRLVECLGRDRTRHQVAEVTSLGLVQMTRKRIGTGLLESFSHDCEHCHGRGVSSRASPSSPAGAVTTSPSAPVAPVAAVADATAGSGQQGGGQGGGQQSSAPSPQDVAAMARAEKADEDARADAAGTSGEDARAEDASRRPADRARPSEHPGRHAGRGRRGRQPSWLAPRWPVRGPLPRWLRVASEGDDRPAEAGETPQDTAPVEDSPVEDSTVETVPTSTPPPRRRRRSRASPRWSSPPRPWRTRPRSRPRRPLPSPSGPGSSRAPVVALPAVRPVRRPVWRAPCPSRAGSSRAPPTSSSAGAGRRTGPVGARRWLGAARRARPDQEEGRPQALIHRRRTAAGPRFDPAAVRPVKLLLVRFGVPPDFARGGSARHP